MVQAYNFLAAWQLFPEKGMYEQGERPKSGIYKIESPEARPDDSVGRGKKELIIYHNWVTLENQALSSQYHVVADGGLNPFSQHELADHVQVNFIDSISFEIHFYKKGEVVLHIVHEIMPNGYLRIIQQGVKEDGTRYTNTEQYHKQVSVLPRF